MVVFGSFFDSFIDIRAYENLIDVIDYCTNTPDPSTASGIQGFRSSSEWTNSW